MDSLKQSYRDFLKSVKDVYYKDFDNKQRETMVRIMYRLRTWFLEYNNPDNISIFVNLYGEKRLFEINVVWNVFESYITIDRKYVKLMDHKYIKKFSLDFVKYIMYHDIHKEITIDAVCKCIEKHGFDEESMFFEIISSYEGADELYYLTLLEEFGGTITVLNNLYQNVYDIESFMAILFKVVHICDISTFLYDTNPDITQKMVDAFVDNILLNKYHKNEYEIIALVINLFADYGLIIPYDELIHNEIIIDLCKSGDCAPGDICDIIAEFSNDDVSFLKSMIKSGYKYNSSTMKLAVKNGNTECAKHMKRCLRNGK